MNCPRNLTLSLSMTSRFAMGWVVAIVMCIPAEAGDAFPEPAPKVKTYEWMLSPAKEPRFALQHQLLPTLDECTRGNAATHYYRALELLAGLDGDMSEENQRTNKVGGVSPDELPLDEMKSWLASRAQIVQELEKVARCETCDWRTRFQDLRGFVVFTEGLNEFQKTRQLTLILCVKARMEIAEKRYDAALQTIKQSYRLARELAKVPSCIVNLIAFGQLTVTNDSLRELIVASGSPNLYWALRGLPEPFIDIGPSIVFESSMALRVFPFLSDADTAQRSPENWEQLLRDINLDDGQMDSQLSKSSFTALAKRSYPFAKRELIAAGYSPERLEQMPVGQVLAIYTRDSHRYVTEQLAKWANVPYPDCVKGRNATRDLLIREGYIGRDDDAVLDRDPFNLNSRMVGVDIDRAGEATLRAWRFTTALTTIEAIRMHAAGNAGRFPESLAEITVVPVPSDPGTGKPLLYRVVDNQAELLAVPTKVNDEFSGRRYLLRMR